MARAAMKNAIFDRPTGQGGHQLIPLTPLSPADPVCRYPLAPADPAGTCCPEGRCVMDSALYPPST